MAIRQNNKTQTKAHKWRWRYLLVITLFVLIACGVLARLLYIDFVEGGFLRDHSEDESQHLMIVDAGRGEIFDRNGVPLAISVPIDAIILDPKTLLDYPQLWPKLASNKVVGLSEAAIKQLLQNNPKSRYLILKKNVPPSLANTVTKLKIPGVYSQTFYSSYYPMGASMAQLVGFTNVNNQGQDGLELAYNNLLKGSPGERLVTETAIKHITHLGRWLQKPKPGHDLNLSIDSRVQFIAYQALKKEVDKTHAISGSVAVLDPKNGQVLAAVSYPSFNPNNLADHVGPYVRNRALTDTFEPGSTMKVMTLSAALDSGKYTPETPINTSPGYWMVQGHAIHDDSNIGLTTVTGVLKYSSNVGASKIALSLPWHDVYDRIANAGFGSPPGGFFPGTTAGYLPIFHEMSKLEFATLSFGYDVTASTLQLARAYAAVANAGIEYPISFLKQKHPPEGKRLMPVDTASKMMQMMKAVVEPGGSGTRARIAHYQVVGKTGTSEMVGPHGFYKHRHNSVFVGIVPMKNPQLVIAVHLKDPKGWAMGFGGWSSAPVFANIASQSMEVLGNKV